jgi:3-hydroxyacyl-[acyl-carrier-protein] dehydratase
MSKLIDAVQKYILGTVLNDSSSEITGEFSFDKEFIGFSGHFPGYPILPAVLQLYMAQLLIEKQKGCKVMITRIVKAKFLSEIRPGDRITVQCIDSATDETLRTKVRISCGERSVSSFNIDYRLKENR